MLGVPNCSDVFMTRNAVLNVASPTKVARLFYLLMYPFQVIADRICVNIAECYHGLGLNGRTLFWACCCMLSSDVTHSGWKVTDYLEYCLVLRGRIEAINIIKELSFPCYSDLFSDLRFLYRFLDDPRCSTRQWENKLTYRRSCLAIFEHDVQYAFTSHTLECMLFTRLIDHGPSHLGSYRFIIRTTDWKADGTAVITIFVRCDVDVMCLRDVTTFWIRPCRRMCWSLKTSCLFEKWLATSQKSSCHRRSIDQMCFSDQFLTQQGRRNNFLGHGLANFKNDQFHGSSSSLRFYFVNLLQTVGVMSLIFGMQITFEAESRSQKRAALATDFSDVVAKVEHL